MVSKTLFAKLLLIVCAGGILIGHFLIHQLSMPAETALRLSEAAMMADGARLYVDFWDNATPFYLYLNLLPVVIARLSFIHPIVISNLLTVLLFMLSAGLMAALSEVVSARRNLVKASIWPLLIALVLVTLLGLTDFAQANQIFFLALCPYIVCRAGTAQGLPVPAKLALAIGVSLGLATIIDPIYCFYFLTLELCILFGFFPFSKRQFVLRRYLGVELKIALILLTFFLIAWLVLPACSASQYLSIISKLNYGSYFNSLQALSYDGCASDSRPFIYLAALFLLAALPTARQSILVRLFGVAALLALGLMIIQGGAFLYQSYPLVGFAAMAFASSMTRQPLLRQLFLLRPLVSKLAWPAFMIKGGLYLPISALFLLVFTLGTYLVERANQAKSHRFDLRVLGYWGVADKSDIGIFSEQVEEYSKVRQPVAILGLGVRPAYPLITQLRRKPGLSLTWGFPIDTLNTLEGQGYTKDMEPLREFKKKMYAQIVKELSAKSGAPALVLIEDGEVRSIMADQGVIKALEDNYDTGGGVSLMDPASQEGHPYLEYAGYRAGFGIYHHK